jgi:hypothetical protein
LNKPHPVCLGFILSVDPVKQFAILEDPPAIPEIQTFLNY